jgi:hypothetical protein
MSENDLIDGMYYVFDKITEKDIRESGYDEDLSDGVVCHEDDGQTPFPSVIICPFEFLRETIHHFVYYKIPVIRVHNLNSTKEYE